MKKVECVIQNRKLDGLQEALRAIGIGGMTVTDVKGVGNEQTRPDPYLFLPKTKVEIYCVDEMLPEIIEIICETCHTGQLGDGKIAVFDIQELVRIRTFERGEAAV